MLPKIEKIPAKALYKVTFDQYSDVEIKDQDMPEVKLRKWGDECFIKLSYPDFSPVNPKQDKGKLKWVNGNKEVHLYPTKVGAIDAFEFEIILKSKPATNKIVLNIESQGLKFYYQPELTQQEINEDIERPENVVGSYAVYHKSKSGNYEILGGKNYMAGKAFHIYRPKIIDAEGNWAWSEQEFILDENGNGQQIITIPQDFLDNAVYPIRHAGGDTFGYETLGTTNAGNLGNAIIGSLFTISEDGIVTSITLGLTQGTNITVKAAIYDSSHSLVANSAATERSVTAVNWPNSEWKTFTVSGSPSLTGSNDYVLVGWAANTIYLAYDTGAENQGHAMSGQTYNGFPSSLAFDHLPNLSSIYATYTPSAPAGTNMEINVGDVWKEVTKVEVNVGDVWKEVSKVQINVGDTWKDVY